MGAARLRRLHRRRLVLFVRTTDRPRQVHAADCRPRRGLLGRVNTKNSSRAGAWCTYKSTPVASCTGGSNRGLVLECAYAAAPQPPPPQPQPQPPQANSKFFPIPMYGQYSASNCINYGGIGCGQQAADTFCKKEGFARATEFKVGYGAPMPWVPGASSACNDPGCARLENVMCVRP